MSSRAALRAARLALQRGGLRDTAQREAQLLVQLALQTQDLAAALRGNVRLSSAQRSVFHAALQRRCRQ